MAVVVVLTALQVESAAVRKLLQNIDVVRHATGTVFEVGEVRGGQHVALAETGETNISAAIVAERAIATFKPRAVFFVGVAGALKDDIRLGDVIVATRVYSYQGGKAVDGGFFARPRGWEAPHDLDQIARLVARARPWLDTPSHGDGAARVHFKPVAAGDVVLNSRVAPLARQLHQTYNDAAAIEMESAGAAHAGHLSNVPVLTVRGISDFADGAKENADADGSQKRAAENAAAFTVAVITELEPPTERPKTARNVARIPVQPLFSDRLDAAPGPLVLGFGSDETVVVVDRRGSIRRWSLRERRRIPGASVDRMLGFSFLGITNTALVATGQPTVAVLSERRLTLVHFDDSGSRNSAVPLDRLEYLARPGGEFFASYTKSRILVRSFVDGAVKHELPCDPPAATPTIDMAGATVATATSKRITITAIAEQQAQHIRIDNIPSAGCQVAFSPDGDLLAYASFREVGVVKVGTDEVIHRRPLTWEQTRMGLGATRMRAVCTSGCDVFQLLRGRLVRVLWGEPEYQDIAPDSRYDDIAIDPAGRYLAAISDSGRIDIWDWREFCS